VPHLFCDPGTDNVDLANLLETTKIDFYGTSSFTAIGVLGNGYYDNYTFTQVPVPAEVTSSIDQHNYAYEWYIETILENSEKGFRYSPFLSSPEKKTE